MTFVRKLELISGTATGLLGAAVTLNMLRTDYETMRRLSEEFPLFQELLVGLLLFLFPSLLVAVGSFLHAMKQQSRGRAMLLVGGSFISITFVLLLSQVAYYTRSQGFRLHFLLAVMAVAAITASLLVRGRK
jgi:hypothetical protein